MEIRKETSRIMKGYAILFIVLHNYLHLQGFVKENEMTFSHDKSALFFSHLSNPSWRLFGDFFSFLGWIGVSVFVFISGYGLVKKYKNKTLNFVPFIRHSWLKLFLLMLPGVLSFICFYALLGRWGDVRNSIISLSLLNNFVFQLFPFNPGSYWYFGLTFQLYLLFYLCSKFVNDRSLLLCTVMCLILQAVINPHLLPDQSLLSWVRHNFIGWLSVFACGMLCANGKGQFLTIKNRLFAALFLLISLALLVFFNANYFSWLLIPFVAVYFFYSLAIMAESCKPLLEIGDWLGKYSACLFVVHPIARFFVSTNYLSLPPVAAFIGYILLTILGAILYKVLYDYLLKKCNV